MKFVDSFRALVLSRTRDLLRGVDTPSVKSGPGRKSGVASATTGSSVSSGVVPQRRKRTTPSKRQRARAREMTLALNRWEHLVRILNWVRREFFDSSELTMHHLSGFLTHLGTIWVFRGKAEAISWIVTRRRQFFAYLASDRAGQSGYLERRRMRKFVPAALLRPVAQHKKTGGDPSPGIVSSLRLFLTALTLMRAERLPVSIDISSIVDPPTVNPQGWEYFRGFVRGFVGALKQLCTDAGQPSNWLTRAASECR